ncbi:patatin [Methylococcaceae bacterium WWC4]|nr:patatin [Methylococcaceae bacterium WWC4]
MNIGLALGSGASRGWSHIGIIRALIDLGIVPNIICGTSIGSLVGASYVANNLEKLEQWATALTKFETVKFFEINTSLNGFVNREKLHYFLSEYVASDDTIIESFDKRYAAVTTDLVSGREMWCTRGSMLEAVWSSISMPGLFPAIKYNNQWRLDGGLVNPVPISVCRALGADIVIAVTLNGDIVGKHFQKTKSIIKRDLGVVGTITDYVRDYTGSVFTTTDDENQPPNLFEAIAGSVNILQDRVTRSRMAGDPPDILLSPKLSHIGLLEFYRATEAINEGRMCVQRNMQEIKHILEIA